MDDCWGGELANPTARCSGMDRATFSRNPKECNCVLLREKDTQMPPAACVYLSFQKEHEWAQHGCKDGCFSEHRGNDQSSVSSLWSLPAAINLVAQHGSSSGLVWLNVRWTKGNESWAEERRGEKLFSILLYFPLIWLSHLLPHYHLFLLYFVSCGKWPRMYVFRI